MSAGCIVPAEYICPVGFFCGWPVDVESAARLPERPGSQQRHFLQKTFLFAVYWYIQHARGFTTMRSINLFILLSYLVLEVEIHKCTTVSFTSLLLSYFWSLIWCSAVEPSAPSIASSSFIEFHRQVFSINSWQTQHVFNVEREVKIAGRNKLITLLVNYSD